MDISIPKSLEALVRRKVDEGRYSTEICAITVEHASKRADIPQFSYEQVTA